jgi:hypothetical protein
MNDKEIADVRLKDADPRARELVMIIMQALNNNVIDLVLLKNSLMALFEYLSSENGRSDANCRAVDAFFMFDNTWAERKLPEPFQDIFGDMSGALHDSISAPEIAENFDSTPEALLIRAKQLRT